MIDVVHKEYPDFSDRPQLYFFVQHYILCTSIHPSINPLLFLQRHVTVAGYSVLLLSGACPMLER